MKELTLKATGEFSAFSLLTFSGDVVVCCLGVVGSINDSLRVRTLPDLETLAFFACCSVLLSSWRLPKRKAGTFLSTPPGVVGFVVVGAVEVVVFRVEFKVESKSGRGSDFPGVAETKEVEVATEGGEI